MAAAADFLHSYQQLELLRFLTCGGVDHGKSTLIGRLLYDSRNVPDDQAASARRNTARYSATESDLDFAMLVDGLRAEREQGITIDVAYRYFATPKRKFIIADAPGHEQYTRNMATGASNCDLALVLVDAREGVVEQTRRHAFIAALLGIRHLVVAVNKMDLAGFDERRFEEIRRDFVGFCARLEVTDVEFIPMSASNGDNVVERSARMPWYRGRPLLDYLENVHVASDRNLIDLRFPVQMTLRSGDARWLAGTIATGVIRTGDEVVVLPSFRRARIEALASGGETVREAFAPMAVTATLDRDLDVSRGDVLAHVRNVPALERELDAMVVWMSETPLEEGREYLFRHAAVSVPCVVADIRYRVDVQQLRRHPSDRLALNEIGRVRFAASRPVAFDSYARNRVMGSFILIDRLTNETAGAGMILDREAAESARTESAPVTAAERARRAGHEAFVIAVDDPRVAQALERLLFDEGCSVVALPHASPAEVNALLNAGMIVIGPYENGLRGIGETADEIVAQLRERRLVK